MTSPESRSPDANPSETANAPDPARYTAQQEREMGVTDDQGRSIQPSTSFVMIALTFVGVAAVAAVIIIVVLRFSNHAGCRAVIAAHLDCVTAPWTTLEHFRVRRRAARPRAQAKAAADRSLVSTRDDSAAIAEPSHSRLEPLRCTKRGRRPMFVVQNAR